MIMDRTQRYLWTLEHEDEILKLAVKVNEEKKVLKDLYWDVEPEQNPFRDIRLQKIWVPTFGGLYTAQQIFEIVCIIRFTVDKTFMEDNKKVKTILKLFEPFDPIRHVDPEIVEMTKHHKRPNGMHMTMEELLEKGILKR